MRFLDLKNGLARAWFYRARALTGGRDLQDLRNAAQLQAWDALTKQRKTLMPMIKFKRKKAAFLRHKSNFWGAVRSGDRAAACASFGALRRKGFVSPEMEQAMRESGWL